MNEPMLLALLILPTVIGLCAVAVTESRGVRRLFAAALLLPLLVAPSRAIIDEDDADWLGRFGQDAKALSSRAQTAAPRAVLEQFLSDWLVRQDIEKALASVDIALDEVVAGNWGIKDQAALETWKRKWLTMWLYRDHGVVAVLGHGQPSAPGYSQLPTKASDVPDRALWREIPNCELIPMPVQIGAHKGKLAYMVPVPMKTAPRDQVVLALIQVRGRWKIALFESIAG